MHNWLKYDLVLVNILLPHRQEWYEKYKHDIPVLYLNGHFFAKHRITKASQFYLFIFLVQCNQSSLLKNVSPFFLLQIALDLFRLRLNGLSRTLQSDEISFLIRVTPTHIFLVVNYLKLATLFERKKTKPSHKYYNGLQVWCARQYISLGNKIKQTDNSHHCRYNSHNLGLIR